MGEAIAGAPWSAEVERRLDVLAVLGAVACLVVLVLTRWAPLMDPLPGFVAGQLTNNSEAVAMVALTLLVVRAVAPHPARRARLVGVAVLLVAAFLVTGGPGQALGLPVAVTTNHEPVIGVLVVLGWLLLPWSRRRRVWPYLVVLGLPLVAELPTAFADTTVATWVVTNAEAWGMAALLVLLVDVVVPVPAGPVPPVAVRWRVALGVGLLLAALALGLRYPGGVDETVAVAQGLDRVGLWLLRNLESFLGATIVLLWLHLTVRIRDAAQGGPATDVAPA